MYCYDLHNIIVFSKCIFTQKCSNNENSCEILKFFLSSFLCQRIKPCRRSFVCRLQYFLDCEAHVGARDHCSNGVLLRIRKTGATYMHVSLASWYISVSVVNPAFLPSISELSKTHYNTSNRMTAFCKYFNNIYPNIYCKIPFN